MIKIFKDDIVQQEFEQNGFVKLGELLGPAEITALTEYYLEITGGGKVENSAYGMYVSLFDKHDFSLKRETMAEIRRVVYPRLSQRIHECKTHLGSYLVKVPNPKSFTYPHQDWTFVDNEQMDDYCSLTVWITLKDIEIETGSLGFIKGSHRFFDNVIGSPSPAIRTLTQGHEPLFFQYLTFPKVKAGDAFAFNNKCIHAALPNTSQFQRIALGIGLTPEAAPLYHYYLKPGTNNRVLKLRTDEEFFVRYGNQELHQLHQAGQIPDYCEVEGELWHEFDPISARQMQDLCVQYGSMPNGLNVNLQR